MSSLFFDFFDLFFYAVFKDSYAVDLAADDVAAGEVLGRVKAHADAGGGAHGYDGEMCIRDRRCSAQ